LLLRLNFFRRPSFGRAGSATACPLPIFGSPRRVRPVADKACPDQSRRIDIRGRLTCLGDRDNRVGQRCRHSQFESKLQRTVIRVSLAALVTIYLLLSLATIFLLWIVDEWNRRR